MNQEAEIGFDEAVAVGFANLKGSKRKDFLLTARALKRVREEPGFQTNASVGRFFGVSGEMVREFIALLSLPTEVQALFADQRLNLEHGRQLGQIVRKRPDLVSEAARLMTSLTARDARDLADYLRKHPHASLQTAAQEVEGSKPQVRREYHVVSQLNEDQYKRALRAARGRGLTVHELVTSFVLEGLGEGARRTRQDVSDS